MMKTTQKAIQEGYHTIICVSYCNLQTILSYENPIAYTSRREGWAADIYDMGGGVAIVTGYAPFGNVRPGYDICRKYEKQAEKIRHNYDISYDRQLDMLKNLAKEFVKEVCENE